MGEHHEDPARAAQAGERVGVLVGRDAPERVAAVARRGLERLLDVVDGERDTVRADLVGERRLRLDRLRVEVLEELEVPRPRLTGRAPSGARPRPAAYRGVTVIESSSAKPVPPAKFGDPFASRITLKPAFSVIGVAADVANRPQPPVGAYDTVEKPLPL